MSVEFTYLTCLGVYTTVEVDRCIVPILEQFTGNVTVNTGERGQVKLPEFW